MASHVLHQDKDRLMSQTRQAAQLMRVEEALDYILSRISPLGSRLIPLVDALDRVLAQDIVSTVDIPPFINSAMDGYSVRSADVAGASSAAPTLLRVVAELAAGAVPDCQVGPGAAVRIMTG